MLNDLSGRLTTKLTTTGSDAGRSQQMRSEQLAPVSDGIRQPGRVLQASGQTGRAVVDLANADADNGSGRAWTRLELL